MYVTSKNTLDLLGVGTYILKQNAVDNLNLVVIVSLVDHTDHLCRLKLFESTKIAIQKK